MTYETKQFENLKGLVGVSENTINHHLTLYAGYVANTNKLIGLVETLSKGTPEYNEIKRRLAWERNGLRLHELFFENLRVGENNFDTNSEVGKLIVESFGTYEKWAEDFKATATVRGIGWAVLVYDELDKKVRNIWVGEHDLGMIVDTKVLLVLDVWEHAYYLDYGPKRADYVTALVSQLDWNLANNRLK
jgi:Fe-Mn family superoxide dismutase